jgi:hypothetical protein
MQHDSRRNARLTFAMAVGQTIVALMMLFSCYLGNSLTGNSNVLIWVNGLAAVGAIAILVAGWVSYLRAYIDYRIDMAFGKDNLHSVEIDEREGGIGRYPKAH